MLVIFIIVGRKCLGHKVSALISIPILIGREHELLQLNQALNAAIDGEGGFVLISGEAGMGKTRLAEELGRIASSLKCRVIVGHCLPSVQIPFLPFQEALDELSSEPKERAGRLNRIATSVKRSAPDIAGAVPIAGTVARATVKLFSEYWGSPGDKTACIESLLLKILDTLRLESSKEPIVILLEDLQWADSSTVGTLHFLARNIADQRILILGTQRMEEARGPEGEVGIFLDSLRVMRREGLVREVRIPPLEKSEVQRLISSVLGFDAEGSLVDRIHGDSGGNPLFVVEIVKLLSNKGAIEPHGGAWRLRKGFDYEIPSTIKEVIKRRIDRLSKEQRQVLEAAAILGSRFDPSVLEAVVPLDSLKILEVLDSLEGDLHLVEEGPDGFLFSHLMVQSVVYEGISPARRREMHRRIGERIESSLGRVSPAVLAFHCERAGSIEKFRRYAVEAGDESASRYSYKEAASFYKRAMSEMKGDTDSALRARALVGLGECEMALGNFPEASGHLHEVSTMVGVDPAMKRRALMGESDCWSPTIMGKGDATTSMRLLDAALSLNEGITRKEIALIELSKASIELLMRNIDGAEALSKEAEREFSEMGDLENLLFALSLRVSIELAKGDIHSAMSSNDKACRLLAQAKNPSWAINLLWDRGMLRWYQGKTVEALEGYNELIELCRKFGMLEQISWTHFYRSMLHQSVRDFPGSMEEARKALDIAQQTGSSYILLASKGLMMFASLKMGDLARSETLCEEMVEMARSFSWTTSTPSRGLVPAYRAAFLAEKGLFEESDALFAASLELLKEAVNLGPLLSASVLTWWGEALAKRGEREEARAHFLAAIALYKKFGSEAHEHMATRLMSESIGG